MKILKLKKCFLCLSIVILSVFLNSCQKDDIVENTDNRSITTVSKDDVNLTRKMTRSNFVYVEGKKLFLNGKEWIAHGATLYPTGPNSNFKDSGFRDYMKSNLDLAVRDNFTTIRIVNFIDGVTIYRYDAQVWENIDYLIAEAAARNLKVVLDLSTFRNYLLQNKRIMPYNYADWKGLLDFVGKRYKNNPTVWMYSLAGEADGPRAGDQANIPQRPTTQQLTTFYKEASNALHAVAPDQLISCGGFIFLDYDSGIDWKSIYALPNIHVPAIHIYGDAMKIVTPEISNWCKTNNKPLFLEEFGKEKTISDYAISKYFQEIYDLTRSNGLVGACFWNYGPQTSQYSFDLNRASTPITLVTVRHNSPIYVP